MLRRTIFGPRRRISRLVFITLLIVVGFSTYRRHQIAATLSAYLPDYIQPDDCKEDVDLGNIAVVVKTGATEASRLIPTLLRTTLRCVKNPIIVSDLEQEIEGIRLHNVLADFAPRAMERNTDFDIYHLQQKYQDEGREKDIPQLSSMSQPHEDWRTSGKSAAWGLDKYKNIRMVELAWRLQPDREWYFFIDADTYLIWNNLLAWLSNMDHTKPLYVGQPVRMREHKPRPLDFGYGGAGILLSGAAVRTYAEERPGLVQRWDRRIQGWWFGDFMLADALDEELDLNVTDGTPMLAGDSPSTMAFGPYNWCRPVVTTHHLGPSDAKGLYKIERAAGSSLLLGRDVYHGFSRDDLPKQRGDWDNLSGDARFKISIDGDLAHIAHNSLAACEAACQTESRCFQYTLTEHAEVMSNGATRVESRCHLSSVFRLGQQRTDHWGDKQQHRKVYTSGWNLVRITSWTLTNNNCSGVKYPWAYGPGVIDDKS